MSQRTAFLSKLIGLYCILVAIPMALNKAATLHMVAGLVNDAPVLYLFGLTIVAAGLAIVLSHNVWSGGALRVIVTLIGWITLLKGCFSCLRRLRRRRESQSGAARISSTTISTWRSPLSSVPI